MKYDDNIRDENLQFDFKKEQTKILPLLSGKTVKYEYLAGEEKPPDQIRVIEQAKFTYSPLGKGLEKQTKIIEDQVEKWIKAIEEHGKQRIKSNTFAENESELFDKEESKYTTW